MPNYQDMTRNGFAVTVRSDDYFFTIRDSYDRPVGTLNAPRRGETHWSVYATDGTKVCESLFARVAFTRFVATLPPTPAPATRDESVTVAQVEAERLGERALRDAWRESALPANGETHRVIWYAADGDIFQQDWRGKTRKAALARWSRFWGLRQSDCARFVAVRIA